MNLDKGRQHKKMLLYTKKKHTHIFNNTSNINRNVHIAYAYILLYAQTDNTHIQTLTHQDMLHSDNNPKKEKSRAHIFHERRASAQQKKFGQNNTGRILQEKSGEQHHFFVFIMPK